MTDTLIAYLRGVRVGVLHRTDKGRLVFAYERDYRAAHRIPLSPSLPLERSEHVPKQVESYVEGLLPENIETRRGWARTFATSTSAFDLLTHMGLDCAGAVQFVAPDDVGQIESGGQHEPISKEEIGRRLAELANNGAAWTMPDEHWSLPGQQGKFALALVDGQWLTAHGAAPTTHILKPGVRTLKHQALVEHVTMQAANVLGLNVAETTVMQFGGETAIVVRRFDRIEARGGIQRLHQVDLCQALATMPLNKYEIDHGPTVRDIGGLLRRVSSDVSADLRRFSDAVMFNYVSGSPDGHSKNYSLIYVGGQTRLAPLYDVATGLAYNREDLELGSVAMAVGGRRRLGTVDRRGWEKHARELELNGDERLRRLREMLDGVVDAFARALDDISDVDGASEVAERLLPALKRHVSGIRERAQIGTARAPRSRLKASTALERDKASPAPAARPGYVWVPSHTRRGRPVEGHWRERRQRGE